jgi:hypothetical protein
MRTQLHPAARALLSCALVGLIGGSLIGCGVLDRGAVPLGPTVVTPSANPTETPEPTATGTPSASPTDTSTPSSSPTATPSPTQIPSPTLTGPTTRQDPVLCRPDSGNQAARSPGTRGGARVLYDEDAELDAESQRGDGRSVAVDEVQSSRADGLVVVCAQDTGLLLGWKRVPRSDFERSERIQLQEPLSGTKQLVVALLADDGDGTLDWATDRLVTDDDDDVNDLVVERLTYRSTR